MSYVQPPEDPVNDDGFPDGDYRTARQISAGVLIALVVVLVITASLASRPVDVPAMLALLATAAGLMAVDLPSIRR